MTVPLSRICDLPHALRESQRFAQRLAGRRPAVFLDYDGTLTPIVDRPEDAVSSERMRDVVRGLAVQYLRHALHVECWSRSGRCSGS